MESDVEATPMTQEVIAADREAAAVLFDRVSRASWNSETDPHSEAAQHILRGDGDGSPFVQAFAAHRLAHLPNTDLSEERAREVLRQVTGAGPNVESKYETWFTCIRAMQQYAAGLQGENQRLRIGYDALAPLVDYLPHPHCVTATDAIRTALGDTQ